MDIEKNPEAPLTPGERLVKVYDDLQQKLLEESNSHGPVDHEARVGSRVLNLRGGDTGDVVALMREGDNQIFAFELVGEGIWREAYKGSTPEKLSELAELAETAEWVDTLYASRPPNS